MLQIGTDAFPASKPLGLGTKTANSRITMNGTIAHELVGHREACLAGRAFEPASALDEAQASIRAARFGIGLTSTERSALLRDAINRLNNVGIKIRDVKDILYIQKR
jgi:hypothetical protein